jgi:hypothetical protein
MRGFADQKPPERKGSDILDTWDLGVKFLLELPDRPRNLRSIPNDTCRGKSSPATRK